MAYETLGYRIGNSAADASGLNQGNWTTVFDDKVIGVNVPFFECYHFYVAGVAGGSFQVYINGGQWDYQLQGQANGWDPSQPMILRPGDTIYFFWDIASTVTPGPEVTAWFRYDNSFPYN